MADEKQGPAWADNDEETLRNSGFGEEDWREEEDEDSEGWEDDDWDKNEIDV